MRVQELLGARVGRDRLHVLAHVAARAGHTAAPAGVRGDAWRQAGLVIFDRRTRRHLSSCAITSASSIAIRSSTATKRRTPAWCASASDGYDRWTSSSALSKPRADRGDDQPCGPLPRAPGRKPQGLRRGRGRARAHGAGIAGAWRATGWRREHAASLVAVRPGPLGSVKSRPRRATW